MLPSGWHYSVVCKVVKADKQALTNSGSVEDLTGVLPHLVDIHEGNANKVTLNGALEVFFHDCTSDAAQRKMQAFVPGEPDASKLILGCPNACGPY